jgi:signal transduction histidine kinase
MSDQIQIVLIAAVASGAVGAVGLLGLLLLRRRSLMLSLLLLGVVAVAAMAAGTLATAQQMFLSTHDLGVVEMVCAVAGAVTLLTCWLLGRRIESASQALRRAARSIGDEGVFAAVTTPIASELDGLSRDLAATSARLAASRERERTLEKARRELVAWVSHDLRTPLAGLRAMTEALEDGVAEDPARYHKQLRMEVDRLAALVDGLFELSRVQSGTLRLHLEPVGIGDLVSDAVASAEPLARHHGVWLRGEAGPPLLVTADSRELSRVFTNLLVNAIRHTPADGTVHVAIDTSNRRDVVISVSDCCGGIPEADLARVFDTAWRGNHARTPGADGAGAGLGLAIVRGIVEAHSGHVTVANTAYGCRFDVRLPLATLSRP